MSSLSTILLIAIRDFKERVASRAFQVSTAFTVLIVIGFLMIPTFIDSDETSEWTIGVVGDIPPTLAASVAVGAGDTAGVSTVAVADWVAAEQALRNGDVDIAVDGAGKILVDDGTDPQLTSLVATVVTSIDIAEQAEDLGLDATQVADLFSGNYEIENLAGEEDTTNGDRAFAFFATIILFMSIITYGSWILIGVIEEKTNRVVEVVLGTVKPHQLLAGKVLGIGVLGIAQVLLLAVTAMAVLALQSSIEIPDAAGTVLVWAFIWYVLGFSFYAVAYAAAGSLVSRQEEAQNAAFPLTMMLMASYFVASFSINGDNTILRVASLIPMFAPMTMPIRIAGGDATTVEIVVSVTLMVAAIYGLIRLAGRIYAGGLLQSGSRVRWREAWRASES